MDSDTADIITNHFALACVKPSTNLNAERPDFLGNGRGAGNAAGWTVKGREKAVSSRFHFLASKARESCGDEGGSTELARSVARAFGSIRC
ncbi:hypothetical protein ACRQ5Q_23975 [Bradyrhizobium sp. PMVTL-01]|uniref:hypothetical protein n=1 Tax=Bradyrhizobium sp. PMVTL-01 TaxID=3434999 RepID=UPI003F7101FA